MGETPTRIPKYADSALFVAQQISTTERTHAVPAQPAVRAGIANEHPGSFRERSVTASSLVLTVKNGGGVNMREFSTAGLSILSPCIVNVYPDRRGSAAGVDGPILDSLTFCAEESTVVCPKNHRSFLVIARLMDLTFRDRKTTRRPRILVDYPRIISTIRQPFRSPVYLAYL